MSFFYIKEPSSIYSNCFEVSSQLQKNSFRVLAVFINCMFFVVVVEYHPN